MSNPKVVLAFSGGLDTSFCVKYLSEDKGLDVHSAIVNTGGFSAEELIPALERLISAYLELRESNEETFLETYRRLGLAPFKTALYPDSQKQAA